MKGCWKHFANELKKGVEKVNFADGFLPQKPNERKKQYEANKKAPDQSGVSLLQKQKMKFN